MTIEISFGDAEIWAADIAVKAGAQPSRFLLDGEPKFFNTDEPEALVLRVDDAVFSFQGCKILSIEDRPSRWGDELSARYIVEDRRWAWWDKLTTCDYNRLRCDGTRYNEASAKDIFDDLFNTVGEFFRDTNLASQDLFPTLFFSEPTPAGKILEELCRLTHHTIGIDWGTFDLQGRTRVYPLGVGGAADLSELKSSVNLVDRTPSFTAVSLPAIYESEIDLTPVAMESDGELVEIDSVSYKPAGGWGDQWPGQYADVDSGSQHLAMRSMYRLFTPGTVTNDQASGQLSLEETTPFIIAQGDCAYNSRRSAVIVDEVTGEFWPELHRADNTTSSGDHYFGGVEHDGNVFKFDRPVFKVDDGTVSPPVLKAKARHWAQDGADSFLKCGVGSGPERLAEWVQPIVVHGEGTNLADVEAQLEEYRRILELEYSWDSFMAVVDGLERARVDGLVTVIRHKINMPASSGGVETELYYGAGWEGLNV